MSKLAMKYTPTARGFDCYEFTDFYGEACSLQKSSLAEIDAIWLGCNNPKTHAPTGHALSGRMHLTREQVAELLPKLRHFVRTGNLSRPRKRNERVLEAPHMDAETAATEPSSTETPT